MCKHSVGMNMWIKTVSVKMCYTSSVNKKVHLCKKRKKIDILMRKYFQNHELGVLLFENNYTFPPEAIHSAGATGLITNVLQTNQILLYSCSKNWTLTIFVKTTELTFQYACFQRSFLRLQLWPPQTLDTPDQTQVS